MAKLIFYKCATCRNKLGVQRAYYATGIPFLECEKCGTTNLINKHRTEWVLKTRMEKVDTYFRAIVSVAGIGGGSGVLLYLTYIYLSHYVFGSVIPRLMNLNVIFWLAIVTTPITYFFVFRELNASIAESRRRMLNPEYVKKLRDIGLANELT